MSIQAEIARINAIKERIRTNLVAQGVTVPSDAKLDEMATQILAVAGEQGEIGYYIKATVDRQAFTDSQWATYGTVGRTENWGETSNTGFRVGDIFMIIGVSTDTGKGHLALYKYTGYNGGTTLSGECMGHHIIAADSWLRKSGGNMTGHIYLTGAKASSSTGNTSQIIFGTESDQHLALSSNTGMLVLNPNATSSAGQILLKLGGQSTFPNGISSGTITPSANNSKTLGSSSLKWSNVYATTFTGNLTGTASKATADANGNNIANTYATKSTVEGIQAVLDIPSFVKTEAESVIDRVLAAQTGRTFTFAAITDLHYGNGSYTDGVVHACQAMKYIDERVKLDAVAVLGDYTDGYPADGLANAIGDFKAVNGVLDKLRFATNLRQQGNHDYYANNFAKTHRFIQAYSDDVVWGDKLGGYYYRDFDDHKLRVISVNTVETGNANVGCSTAQYNWFISSLDLSAKDDADEWQILILSHHPLDWYPIDETYRFCYILEAYKNGASWSGGGVSCDFSGKNAATLIGNIHGHIHNLLTGYINKGNINTSNPTDVLRMCTPEACINRANQYTGGWADTATYNKTINTAKDTSFCIYCIDLDSYTITAVCYGAGYDRNVTYWEEPPAYTNLIPKSIGTDGKVYNGVGYKNGYRLNSSGSETAQSLTGVTGYIPIKKGDTVYLKNCKIAMSDSVLSDIKDWVYLSVYDTSFNHLFSFKTSMYTSDHLYLFDNYTTDPNTGYITSFYVKDTHNNIVSGYIRISMGVMDGSEIITINEEIE